jgi:putative transposase
MTPTATRKTYRYRLYPTRAQAGALSLQLSEACRLYNAALQERRDAWRVSRTSLNFYTQSNQLKEIRATGDLLLPNHCACQDVLRRVDRTFQAFFARVKKGVRAGFPRFKSHSRYDSLTFPKYGNGCKMLDGGRLRLQGIGHIKVKLHRPVGGRIKTVTVKREAGRWYAAFSVECEAEPLPASPESVGIDVGLAAFATLSDGTEIENPKYYDGARAKLRRAQRRVARRKKGGSGRRQAVRLLQRAHARIRNQRADFHHKVSRRLVNRYGLIAVEDLNIKGLAKGMLAGPVADAGWGAFLDKMAYKAANAGRLFVRVNPRGTTRDCSGCGARVPKRLSDRTHECPACALRLPRDENAALNILRLGLSLADVTYSAASSVSAEAAG